MFLGGWLRMSGSIGFEGLGRLAGQRDALNDMRGQGAKDFLAYADD